MKDLPSAGVQSPNFVSFTPLAHKVALEEIARRAAGAGSELAGWYFRVGLKGGGCSGFEYYIDIPNSVTADDYVFSQGQLNIAVDKKSALFLDGLVVDYVDSLLEKKFVFKNPNAGGSCGCGSSVSF